MTPQTNHTVGFAKQNWFRFLVALAVFASCVGIRTQERRRAVWFNVAAAEYIASSFYDEPPIGGAKYLFYQGESIKGALRLSKFSDTTEVVGSPPETPYVYRWLETPSTRPSVGLDTSLFLDAIGTRSFADLGSDVPLPARGSLVVEFQLETTELPAGVYRVQFQPRGWTTERPIVIDDNVLFFELRQPDELPEILDSLYRSARRSMFMNDLPQAGVIVDSMLARHPDSAIAYALKGEIAERRGRNAEADEARRQSRLAAPRDELYQQRARTPLRVIE